MTQKSRNTFFFLLILGDPQEECTRCGKMYLCGTNDGLCTNCRQEKTSNNQMIGDSAEDSSGNHTEDSNTPE